MRSMTRMRDFGVTAFVGLEQSCEKEASLAAAFNMTLVSYVSVRFQPPNSVFPFLFLRT